MFDTLTDKFDSIFRKIRGADKLSESNVQDALREVKLALLEADVHFKVVREFVENVKVAALGSEVTKGVDPGQQFIHIVYTELQKILAPPTDAKPFELAPGRDEVILMLGLQGAGKTTFCGKLARFLEKEKRRPMLVACDIHRPAAIEQLKSVGKSVNVPVFEMGTNHKPVDIVRAAQKKAKESGRDLLIVDTAGRLHIDEVRMDELKAIRDAIDPDYTFLVCDAMTGQDVVNSASTFHREVGIDGVCLTKMDGDARGGAALSVRSVTGRPIVFIGTGERADDLDRFHPERIAQRILGMGDVVSLVEKAQATISEQDAVSMQQKVATGKFNYNDFLNQMRMIKRMGSLKGLLSMIPGVGRMLKDVDDDMLAGSLKRVEAMISSMTSEERENGDLLIKEGRRRARVAKGSGHNLEDVNSMVQQFNEMRKMMQQVAGLGPMPGMGAAPPGGGFGGGMGAPPPGFGGGMPPMPKPGDPAYDRLLAQHREMLRERKVQSRFLTKQKKKRR